MRNSDTVGVVPQLLPVLPSGGRHRELADDAISAFTHAPIAICVGEPDGVVTRTNEAMTQLLGYHQSDLIGRDLFRLLPADLVAGAVAACASLQRGTHDTVVHETRFTTSTGQLLDVRVTTSAVREPATSSPHVIMHLEDITEREDLRRRLEHQASHDHLTGLANRAHFLDQLQRAMARAHRHRQPATVLYLDLDGFKGVNDDLGHAAGDQLLIAFAEHLRDNVRPEDTVARLGGDEFAVLCEATTAAGAAPVIDRLAADTWSTRTPGARVGVTIGSATLLQDGLDASTAQALLHAADQAMYAAKAHRRTD